MPRAPSTKTQHSYTPFYHDDWKSGTARMGSLHRLVFFEVCLFNWEYREPVTAAELSLIFHDLPEWVDLIDALVAAGKLRLDDRGYWKDRAIAEADKAFDLWERKSTGGKKTQGEESSESGGNSGNKTLGESDVPKTAKGAKSHVAGGNKTGAIEPEPEPEIEEEEAAALAKGDVVALANAISAATGLVIDPSRRLWSEQETMLRSWLDLDIKPEEIVAVVRERVAAAHTPVATIRYFDAAVRQSITRREHLNGNAASNNPRRSGSRPASRADEMDATLERFLAAEADRPERDAATE